MPSPEESLTDRSTQQLLRLYGAILTELIRRKVIRSRNAPAGDFAEHLAATVYGGELAPPSAKSWDIESADGQRIQVKCRVVEPGRNGNYSFFRSYDFDLCIFVQLNPTTYDVTTAIEVPADAVKSRARHNAHVNGARIQLRDNLLTLPGAHDRTDEFRAALDTSA